MKNLLPVKENAKIIQITDAIQQAGQDAKEQNAPFLFTVDLDTDTFTVEAASPEKDDTSEEKEKPSPAQSELTFTKARNSTGEAVSGSISFLFLPDGTKEFGMILVFDPNTNDFYTIFINPYQSAPEILNGETAFNEYRQL